MPTKKPKKQEPDFVDELIEEASTLFGLLDGEVDNGKPNEPEERNEDESDEDDEDDERTPANPGREKGARKAEGKQNEKQIVHEFRHIFSTAAGGTPKRGPGRPPSSKKKPAATPEGDGAS